MQRRKLSLIKTIARLTLPAAILLALLGVRVTWAVTYPLCPSGVATSCTMTIHVTTAVTPIFARFNNRQYLFLQNTGYTFSASAPSSQNNVVFCAIGSNNSPQAASASASNVIVIQPGGVYEPPQMVQPQSSFRVPAGDIACVAPSGDVWLTIEQE